MNKKVIKIISFIVIILSIIIISTSCFATLSPADIDGKASGIESNTMKTVGNQIATVIRNAGIVASVIILMILGIKYMMGSAAEKAEYKKTMIPYVVGAIVLFGASAIAGAIVQLAEGITGESAVASVIVQLAEGMNG